MVWVKLSDLHTSDPVWETVGIEAAWLYLDATCYAQRHLTNGKVPYRWFERHYTFDNALELADRLLSAGKLDRDQTTERSPFTILGFSDDQRDADYWHTRRTRERDRKRRQRLRASNGDHPVEDPDEQVSQGGQAGATPTGESPSDPGRVGSGRNGSRDALEDDHYVTGSGDDKSRLDYVFSRTAS